MVSNSFKIHIETKEHFNKAAEIIAERIKSVYEIEDYDTVFTVVNDIRYALYDVRDEFNRQNNNNS